MELLHDGVIAFLSAVGVTACVWLVAGAFFGGKSGNPEIVLMLPLRGEANAMEADLRELVRARRSLSKARIWLVDCGMDSQARELAEYFCLRYPYVELRGREETVIR